MARQAERLEATRAAILSAATARFGQQGYGATSIDEIAAGAGVAKGAIYHHFESKRRLFETVLEVATSELALAVTARAGAAVDVWDGLALATETYFELVSSGAASQIVLKDGPAVLGWERWRAIDAQHFGKAIPAILGAAMKQGLIAEQPIVPLARLLLGAATEAAAACAASPDPAETGRAHAQAFRALLGGLRLR